MAGHSEYFTISDTSPAAEGAAAGDVLTGLDRWRITQIYAALVGATGGTLDVYLQRKANGVWVDWVHFTQLAAGAPAIKYSIPVEAATKVTANHIVTVGAGTSPVLATGAFAGGQPGESVRAYYVAGASTSAGAAVTIILTGQRL